MGRFTAFCPAFILVFFFFKEDFEISFSVKMKMEKIAIFYTIVVQLVASGERFDNVGVEERKPHKDKNVSRLLRALRGNLRMDGSGCKGWMSYCHHDNDCCSRHCIALHCFSPRRVFTSPEITEMETS